MGKTMKWIVIVLAAAACLYVGYLSTGYYSEVRSWSWFQDLSVPVLTWTHRVSGILFFFSLIVVLCEGRAGTNQKVTVAQAVTGTVFVIAAMLHSTDETLGWIISLALFSVLSVLLNATLLGTVKAAKVIENTRDS